MTQFLKVLFLLLAVVANTIVIKQTAFKEDKPTCDNYILNTYLYVLLAFIIISTLLVAGYENKMIESNIMMIFSSWMTVIIFIVSYIGLIIWFHSVDPKDNILLVHILWLLLVLYFSLLLYMPVKVAHMLNVLKPAIIVTLFVTAIVVYLGIKHGDKLVTFDWDKYLRMALMGIIISYFLLIFVPEKDKNKVIIGITIVSLIVFVLLLLSYNKKLTERAKTCYEDNNPNYPKESVGIVIKIINIFMDIARLMGRRR